MNVNKSFLRFFFINLQEMQDQKKTLFLSYKNHTLPYKKYGFGSEILLAFHGFGRSGNDFEVFEKDLGQHYTIIAFDFFYHGVNARNLYDPIESFTSSILANMLEKLLWEEKKVRFSVIGYSLGAKLVLGIIHRLPHRIYELFLLAPDGFTPDYARRILSKTFIGKHISRFAVNNPSAFLAAINASKILGFINEKQQRFFLMSIKTYEDRKRIYLTWQLLKEYSTHLDLANHYLKTRPIRFELFLGKHDQIIKLSFTDKFMKRLKGKATTHLLDCGHQIFQKHEEISKIILQRNF